MAADTSLLLKALTGSPCQDTGRVFRNAAIEHSPERKQSIIIAPLQHQHSAAQREEKEKEEEEYN
uniref:Putative ovule protein n=1 Tax=Solanum chacoense TaxID=4108 RepID=A0A0V0GUN3_SOLCH